jgi:hypothetical protein
MPHTFAHVIGVRVKADPESILLASYSTHATKTLKQSSRGSGLMGPGTRHADLAGYGLPGIPHLCARLSLDPPRQEWGANRAGGGGT